MKMTETGYKIYVMRAGDAPDECEFYRMTARYTLVYTNAEKPPRSAELTQAELSALSPDDRSWVMASMAEEYSRYLKEHEKDIVPTIRERLTAFEKELKKLAEPQEKGESDGGTDTV